MEQILVHLKERTYPIYFSDGKKWRLAEALSLKFRSPQWVVVTNPLVDELYGAWLRREVRKLGKVHTLLISDGERYKTPQTVEKIYKGFVKCKVDRSTPILALGGGVVGDIVGFAAATYLRGVPLVQVPTTFLAQVDSSIGGKTGVDLSTGKNLVGAFYQPHLVFIDVSTLKTLPPREVLCGMAEVIKYGAIKNKILFSLLEKKSASFLEKDLSLIKRAVKECVRIKAEVVEKDEKETSGLRSILNFGHTLGHAIETLSGYKNFSHGEAISVGMAFAAYLSKSLQLANSWTVDRLVNLLHEVGLPHHLPRFSRNAYLQIMSHDKKMKRGKIRYVLLKKLGSVVIKELPLTLVGGALEEFAER